MAEEITLSDSSRVTARRQIATQIAARILSGELGAGRRLPSGRAMARRLRVHRSVVTGAYRELSGWGLVRTAAGSGVFVTGELPGRVESAGSFRLFLEARRTSGRPVADTADLLWHWIRSTDRQRIVVVEREDALRKILVGELRTALPGLRIAHTSLTEVLLDPAASTGDLIIAQRGLNAPLKTVLPPWVEVMPIRFRPANAEVLASAPSGHPSAVAFCTRSPCLGGFARGLLASAYGDRVGLVLVDPADRPAVGRANRICRWIFSDSACAPELLGTLRSTGDGSARVRVVRLVAPRFIKELRGYLRGRSQSEE